jgi:hypothetical protein
MDATAGYGNFKSWDSKAWTNHVPHQRIFLIGSPQRVADWLMALNQAGCDG